MTKPRQGREPVSIHASCTIDASPEQVCALISDVTRMPEWSPELVAARWVGATADARVGARFEGTNEIPRPGRKPLGRKTKPRITEAVPGKAFAFRVPRPSNSVWRYEIAPAASGTIVTDTVDCPGIPALIRLLQRRAGVTDRAAHLRHGMQVTLNTLAATPR